MSTAAKPKTLHTLARRYPGRVLKNIRFDYASFDVHFDLPCKRHLSISVSAYASKSGTIDVYEAAKGSDAHHYWLIDASSYTLKGTDPRPLLLSYLKATIGGVEHGYEGSFAEVILTSFRDKKVSA